MVDILSFSSDSGVAGHEGDVAGGKRGSGIATPCAEACVRWSGRVNVVWCIHRAACVDECKDGMVLRAAADNSRYVWGRAGVSVSLYAPFFYFKLDAADLPLPRLRVVFKHHLYNSPKE